MQWLMQGYQTSLAVLAQMTKSEVGHMELSGMEINGITMLPVVAPEMAL